MLHSVHSGIGCWKVLRMDKLLLVWISLKSGILSIISKIKWLHEQPTTIIILFSLTKQMDVAWFLYGTETMISIKLRRIDLLSIWHSCQKWANISPTRSKSFTHKSKNAGEVCVDPWHAHNREDYIISQV